MATTACSPCGFRPLQQLRSLVLSRLPLYHRIRSFSCTGHDAGAQTPPPGYYDSQALTEPAVPVSAEPIGTGYFPTKRLLGSLTSLLSTDAPMSDLLSTWLGIPLPSATPQPPPPSPPLPPNCDCFSCFQHHHLYLLWLQQDTTTTPPPLHHNPPPPPKPLLHRITATLIVNVFTAAFILYPHLKAALTGIYTWERRNCVLERILLVVVGVAGRVWGLLVWGLGVGVEAQVEEGRVNRWLVRAGGEVLGGVLDGTQMGVGVWGRGVVG
ncbi:hypothetical protein Q9L58_006136 [Maublancomyces gigas]|uniref:Uncharacterized protein n=1 Tax=Discina gigas TaxID=1032678 RepID=A0ABR3GG55_9PEZI